MRAKKKIKKKAKPRTRTVQGKRKVAKKKTKRKKQISVSSAVRVREITVRYGGVIRTGSYENRRLSYEMAADCPRGIKPDIVCDYLESLCANQFYQAQIQALEGLPDEMRDEVDVSMMNPRQASQAIADYFRNFGLGNKTPAQKAKRIAEIQLELKEVALKMKAEDKRLKKIKVIQSGDLLVRTAMVEQRQILKDELKALRR